MNLTCVCVHQGDDLLNLASCLWSEVIWFPSGAALWEWRYMKFFAGVSQGAAEAIDGQARDLLGLIVCCRDDGEIWSEANRAHGYATRVLVRELEKGLAGAKCDRHKHEHGRHGDEVLERHSEEDVCGIDATVLWRETWAGYDGGRFEKGGDDIGRNHCNL